MHNYAFKTLVDDIIELIESLQSTKHNKCVLVGHDWGGIISWTVAQTRPDLVDRFIVINAPHMDAGKCRAAISWRQFFSSWYMFIFNIPFLPELLLRGNDLAFFNQIIDQFSKDSPDERLQTAEVYKHYFGQPGGFTSPLNYYRALLRGYGSGENYPITKVKTKTLIIWGKADMALVSELVDDSAALCEDVTVRYLEKSNHFVQMEDPDKVNELISQFLAK